MFLGFVNALADVAAEPVRIAAATREGRVGLYVAGLAGAVAIVTAGVIFLRRGRGKG